MKCLRTFAPAALLAHWLLSAVAAAAPPSVAERAPANACVAIFSADAAGTCAAFQKTRLGQTFCGPEFAPLVAELTKRGVASAWHLRPAFGFDWSDLAGTHDAAGLVNFSLADGSLGAAWLLVPGEPITKTPACLEAAGRYFQQQGFTSTPRTQGNVNLTVLQPPAARSSESPRVLFLAPNFYGIANSVAAADTLLAVDPAHSLAQDAVFARSPVAERESSSPADVRLFIKPFELLDLVARAQRKAKAAQAKTQSRQKTKQQSADDTPAGDTLETAKRLGFTALQSVAGRISFAAEAPCEWNAEMAISIQGPYTSALRILEFRPGKLPELPPWVPANVISAAAWRWDFPLAMKGFGNLYDEANEPGPDGAGLFDDMLDGLRDDPEGVRVDLRRDLFDHLGPEMVRISEGGADGDRADARRWLYIAGVRDVPTVLATLNRFFQGDNRVTHKREGAYDVWLAEGTASLFVEGESDALVTVRGLALGEGQLFIGTNIAMLSSAVAPPETVPRLKDDPDWSRLLAWVKSKQTETTAYESLMRVDRAIEPSYRAATVAPKIEPAGKAKTRRTKPESPGVRMWRLLLFGSARDATDFPFPVAPKFEAIQAAFPRGGMLMSQSSDGWHVQFGALGTSDVPSP